MNELNNREKKGKCAALEQILRNVALHDHMLTNESSAVNGCRQNESASQYLFGTILDCFDLQVVFDVYIFLSWILSLTEEIKNILMMDIFIRNMHIMLHNILIDGMWITCGLLRCFYQLFGLSFWLTVLASKWCNAKFLQICSDEEINSATSYMTLGWIHFQ